MADIETVRARVIDALVDPSEYVAHTALAYRPDG